MKKFFASILCLGMIFGATGCTSGGDDTYEIAMITDSGSVTDKSFNQSAYEGVKEFGEKNDITYKYYAPKDTDQAGLLSTIDDAVDNGAKVVVTPGFNFSGALYQAQEKYPDVEQKYRFELIDINTGKALEKSDDTSAYNKSIDNVNMVSADNTYTVDKSACDIAGNRYTENKSIDYKTENVSSDNGNIADTYNSDENTVQDSKLIRFLDAYDYKEKLDILTSMRSELNDGLIDIMAESIEVAVPEGDITDRYNSLRKCLLAHTKYEGLRLRQ